MKKPLLFSLFLLIFKISYSQTYVSGVTFTYDGVGNRVLRKVGVVCIGCPKQPNNDTLVAGTPVHDIPYQSQNINIYAYPNPTNKDLYINNESWEKSDRAILEVHDVLGKSILKRSIMQAKDVVSFENLISGTYMIHYYLNDQAAKVWKVIKL